MPDYPRCRTCNRRAMAAVSAHEADLYQAQNSSASPPIARHEPKDDAK